MARIKEETIETLRNLADIVQIISEHTKLKTSGQRLLGLCPFHLEKSPSFFVDPERKMYHCFGCGAGGDVFSFVMQREGLSFYETLKYLAERFGLSIEEENSSDFSEQKAIFKANKFALKVFRHGLLKSPLGEPARNYLKKREISTDSLENFKLGFIPEGWSRLYDYMTSKGFSPYHMEKAGLIVKKKQGGYYDRFRSRIIFPIEDGSGRILAFGGRSLGEEKPKYLNSPESLVYHKTRSLYGFYQGREFIAKNKRVFIVEGYFDVIALHQHGIYESVASLGTSLTREHIQLLRAYTDNFILVFDADEAGLRAAERIAPLFLSLSLNVRVLLLPASDDPDTFIREKGREAFLKEAEKALTLFNFLVDLSIKRWGRDSAARLRSLEYLLSFLKELNDPVLKDLYLRDISEALGINENAIRKRLDTGSSYTREEKKTYTDPAFDPDFLRMQKAMISLILSLPDLNDEIRNIQPESFFSDPLLKKILMFLLYENKDTSLENLEFIKDNEIKKELTSFIFQEKSWNIENARLFIAQFKDLKEKMSDDFNLMDSIKAAEASNDKLRLKALLEQKQQKARKAAEKKLSYLLGSRRHI